MREDFDKLLVERERHGVRSARAFSRKTQRNKQHYRNDPDAAPQCEGMSRRYSRGHSKNLNENLGPLKRFLLNRVGRPWSKVHSEIRKAIPGQNPVQDHVMSHVGQYVETEVEMIDGVPHRKQTSRWRAGVPELIEEGGFRKPQLYVNPENGLLCRAPKRSIRLKEREKDRTRRIDLSWHKALLRKERVWYEVQLAKAERILSRDGAHEQWRAFQKDVLYDLDPEVTEDALTLMRVYGEQDATRDSQFFRTLYAERWFAVSARKMTEAEVRKRVPSNLR